MKEMTLTLTGTEAKVDPPEVARLGRPSEIVLRYDDPAPDQIDTSVDQGDAGSGVAVAILTTVFVVGVLVVAGIAIAEDDRRWRERRAREEAEREEARRERQAKVDDLRVKAAKLRSEAIGYQAADRLSQAAACHAQADSLERDANRLTLAASLIW